MMPERPEHVGDHYKQVKLDTWDALDAWFTPEMRYGFYAGNVIKYLQRAHAKDGLKDIKKAMHYADKVEELLGQHPTLLDSAGIKEKRQIWQSDKTASADEEYTWRFVCDNPNVYTKTFKCTKCDALVDIPNTKAFPFTACPHCYPLKPRDTYPQSSWQRLYYDPKLRQIIFGCVDCGSIVGVSDTSLKKEPDECRSANCRVARGETDGEANLAHPGHAQPGVAGVPQVPGT